MCNIIMKVIDNIQHSPSCKVDVGIMGHLSSSVNFLGCDYWKKARFMVLHNKDMEILKIKLFQ